MGAVAAPVTLPPDDTALDEYLKDHGGAR